MRVEIRKVVNLDNPIDTTSLSAFQKIAVALQVWYRETSLYQRKMNRITEMEYREQAEKEERLKVQLLSRIYEELINNRRLSQNGLECSEVVLAVDRNYKKELMEIIKHREFSAMNITLMECNRDLLRSFKDLKILIRVRVKK